MSDGAGRLPCVNFCGALQGLFIYIIIFCLRFGDVYRLIHILLLMAL